MLEHGKTVPNQFDTAERKSFRARTLHAPTAEAARKIVKELRDTTKSGARVHGKCGAAC